MNTHPRPNHPAETQPIVLRPRKTKPTPTHMPMPHTPSFPQKKNGGFTLLEIMLVVMIIAILGGAAIHYMGGNIGIAQETRVHTDIQAISTQLKIYQAMNGFLPTTEQGLAALVAQPSSEPKPKQWRQFFEKLPQDPWSSNYLYTYPGKHNPNSFDLYSAGTDRKADTADDIGNWESTPK